MVTVSPPVSPRVVARILMIQKPSVTAGTLVSASYANSRSVMAAECRRSVPRSIAFVQSFVLVLDDPAGPCADSDLMDPAALADVERVAPRARFLFVFRIDHSSRGYFQRDRTRLRHREPRLGWMGCGDYRRRDEGSCHDCAYRAFKHVSVLLVDGPTQISTST